MYQGPNVLQSFTQAIRLVLNFSTFLEKHRSNLWSQWDTKIDGTVWWCSLSIATGLHVTNSAKMNSLISTLSTVPKSTHWDF